VAVGDRETLLRSRLGEERMTDIDTPFCMNCGNAMTAAARTNNEPETIFRCEPCKVETWIADDERKPQKRN
jgi:hypothetical protein